MRRLWSEATTKPISLFSHCILGTFVAGERVQTDRGYVICVQSAVVATKRSLLSPGFWAVAICSRHVMEASRVRRTVTLAASVRCQ